MFGKLKKSTAIKVFVPVLAVVIFLVNATKGGSNVQEMLDGLDTESQVSVCNSDNAENALMLFEIQFTFLADDETIDYITYSNGSHEEDDSPRTHSVMRENGEEILEACKSLYKNDSIFADALDTSKADELANKKAYEAEKEAARKKAGADLEKWNAKAEEEGGGTLKEYFDAVSAAESLVKSGASYKFSGANADIQYASCYGTVRSIWIAGKPSGWWSCSIQTLGGSLDFYSIEISGDSWGGSPDLGKSAGRDLNWKIPSAVEDYVRNY